MPDSLDNLVRQYIHQGHPTLEEPVTAQGLIFPRDPRDLVGNFWPEEESIDDFLSALDDWRGRRRTDPAA
jgi:hypothetical protein